MKCSEQVSQETPANADFCNQLSLENVSTKRLCIKPGIQERGTECGEREEQGECYIPGNVAKHSGNVLKHSGECRQTFRGMSPNIPRNVAKYSGECRQTFREMSPNIPGNFRKHSGKCCQIFRGISPNIPGNITKHSGEYQRFHGMPTTGWLSNSEVGRLSIGRSFIKLFVLYSRFYNG